MKQRLDECFVYYGYGGFIETLTAAHRQSPEQEA